MADAHNVPYVNEIIHVTDITNVLSNYATTATLNNYVTTTTFNSTIGNINSILDNINGEVV